MHKTQFAGLTAPDSNDAPLQVDGGSFSTRNPDITDHFLQIGAVTHRHDAHLALGDPTVAASAVVATSGGSIPSGSDIYIGYTLLDSYGGETRISSVVNATTPTELAAPSIAFDAEFVASAGVLPVGSYYYAITMLDAGGGETTIGPSVLVTRPPGTVNGQINFTGLAAELGPDGGALWRLWRADNGGVFNLIASGTSDTFTDPGIDPVDHAATPPTSSRATRSTNKITVTIPDATAEPLFAAPLASAFALYASDDGTFSNPCLYGTYPVASAGTSIDITDLTVQTGAPPDVSRSIPGASKIYAPTDIEWGPDGPPTGGGGGGGFPAPSPATRNVVLDATTGYSGPYNGQPDADSVKVTVDHTGGVTDDIVQERLIHVGMLPAEWRMDGANGLIQAATESGAWCEGKFLNYSGPSMTEGKVTVRLQFGSDPTGGIDVYAILAGIPHGPMVYVDAYVYGTTVSLSSGVYDPSNGDYTSLVNETGSAADMTASPLALNTDYYLQIERVGNHVTSRFFDVDPDANPAATPLAIDDGDLAPASIAAMAYAGYSGFGWGEQDAADGLVEIHELRAHATAGGVPLPPPHGREPGPDVTNLSDGQEVVWTKGIDKLGSLRVESKRSGAIEDYDALTFDPVDLAKIGGVNNFGIFSGYGHDQAFVSIGQNSSFTWLEPDGQRTYGDIEYVFKINRPDVGVNPKGTPQIRFTLPWGGTIWFCEVVTGESVALGSGGTTHTGPVYVFARTGTDAAEVQHEATWGDPPDGDYYLIARRVGADWTIERWLTDPALGGTPEHTATYTDIPTSTSADANGEGVMLDWVVQNGMGMGDVVQIQVDEIRRRKQKVVGRMVASVLNLDGTQHEVELGLGT